MFETATSDIDPQRAPKGAAQTAGYQRLDAKLATFRVITSHAYSQAGNPSIIAAATLSA